MFLIPISGNTIHPAQPRNSLSHSPLQPISKCSHLCLQNTSRISLLQVTWPSEVSALGCWRASCVVTGSATSDRFCPQNQRDPCYSTSDPATPLLTAPPPPRTMTFCVMGWMVDPKDIQGPGTCGCDLTGQQELCRCDEDKDFEMGRLSWWAPRVITRVLIREKQRQIWWQKRDLKMLHCWLWRWRKGPWAKGCKKYSSWSWNRQEKGFSPRASGATWLCPHLGFSPVKLIFDLGPPELKESKGYIKLQCVW